MGNYTNILVIVTTASQIRQEKPFSRKTEDDAYVNLTMLCEKINVNLYITHFSNLMEDSAIFSWIFKNNKWNMTALPASEIAISYADLPPIFQSSNELRKILIQNEVVFFNKLNMSDALTDKLLTYQLFPSLIPPTFKTSLPNLSNRLLTASSHPDLRVDKIILKPQYGERGKGIEVIDFNDLKSDKIPKMDDYIVQPIMESDLGITDLGVDGRHDLRMLIYNGEIKDFFVRVAQKNKFICNHSHGGKFVHFSVDELPKKFKELAKEVDDVLSQYTPRYYSIDVGVGRSGKIWVYELNTMPSLVWDEDESNKEQFISMHQTIIEGIQCAALQTKIG